MGGEVDSSGDAQASIQANLPIARRAAPARRGLAARAPWLARGLAGSLAAAMALSVSIVLWQVLSRYGLGEPSSATDELVRYLLVWIGLFGAAHAALHRHHLAIDLLPQRLHGRALRLQQIGVEAAIGLFAAAVMVAGGARLVAMAAELGQRSAALELPLGWLYLALPGAGLLIAVDAALAIGGLARTGDSR